MTLKADCNPRTENRLGTDGGRVMCPSVALPAECRTTAHGESGLQHYRMHPD